MLCDAGGSSSADQPGTYVYTYKCHVIVDYMYFTHLLKPKPMHRRLYEPVVGQSVTTATTPVKRYQPGMRNTGNGSPVVVVGHGPHRNQPGNVNAPVYQKPEQQTVRSFIVRDFYDETSFISRVTLPSQHNLLYSPLLGSPSSSSSTSTSTLHAHNLIVCVNVVVILHYEAFDMFSDIYPTSLGEELYSQQHCIDLENPSLGSRSQDHVASKTKSAQLNSIQNTFQYFNDNSFVQRILSRYKTINLIGSSHSRYLWDVLVNRYLQPEGFQTIAELSKKHTEAVAGNVIYTANMFVHQLRDVLLNQCSMVEDSLGLNNLDKVDFSTLLKQPHIFKIFVQSGAWNLASSNILYPLLSEKKGMRAVLETIEEIAGRRCSYFLDITVMSSVPAPMQVDINVHSYVVNKVNALLVNNKPHVAEFTMKRSRYIMTCRGYRTNGAVQAWSAYMKHGVSLIEYPSADIKQLFAKLTQPLAAAYTSRHAQKGKLDYLDLVHIMLPFNEDTVDNMHYLKVNHNGRRIDRVPKLPEVSTLAGEIFLGAVVDVLIRT
ncbi:hypothetical protein EON63_11180 [archaeon]|nr:MAG: hypothetical protein EON63_11180 [archaeon]